MSDSGDAPWDVTVDRVLEASPERVWKAFSDSAEIEKWWGPDGFSCPFAQADLRVGGRTLVAMRAPQQWGGGDTYNAWTFTEVDPFRSIRYIMTFCDADGNRMLPSELGLPDGIPSDGEHSITLDDLGDGRTHFVMVEPGYTSEQTRDLSKMGLEQCITKMEASFR